MHLKEIHIKNNECYYEWYNMSGNMRYNFHEAGYNEMISSQCCMRQTSANIHCFIWHYLEIISPIHLGLFKKISLPFRLRMTIIFQSPRKHYMLN